MGKAEPMRPANSEHCITLEQPKRLMIKITNRDDPKVFLVPAILFAVLGCTTLSMFWDGFMAWWHMVGMSYDEVRNTPFEPMWTSGRAMGGFLSLITSFL